MRYSQLTHLENIASATLSRAFMAFVTAMVFMIAVLRVIFPHLFPLPSFRPRRQSFLRASYRKAEDRRGICDRAYGRRAHSFLPNV